MPASRNDIVAFLDRTLDIAHFRDYAVNGLQVEGRSDVRTIVTGVTASLALIQQAIERDADLIVVHHGLFWGDGLSRITGPTRQRLRLLLENDVSLAAYHLPLDKHHKLGNNAGLCDALGLGPDRDAFGDVRGTPLGVAGSFSQPLSRDRAIARIGVAMGSPPRFVFPHGPERVTRVGICSGAASDLLEAAAEVGCDMFVTGELAERAAELAAELRITLVAAGHYDTETFGPMRLAEALGQEFSDVRTDFVAVPTPL